MSKGTPILPAMFLASALAAATAPLPVTLVICAPGYPGTTKEAQPSMDALASAVSKRAGWPVERLAAEYHETEDAGVTRLKALKVKTPTLAMVPLPFFLAHERDLKLTPRAQAVEKDGEPSVTWSLVAKKGRVTSASSLKGHTLVSLAAYAPDFIRKVALAPWGALPPDVNFSANGQLLSSLRKAANGEPVVVLLDPAQAASLKTLPFASELEVVTVSRKLPGIVVCTVGSALKPADADRLLAGLLEMHQSPEGQSALDAVRLAKFVPLDGKSLSAARTSYGTGADAKTR